MRKIYLFVAALSLMALSASCNLLGLDVDTNPYKSLDLSTRAGGFVEQGNDTFTFEFIDRINALSEKDYIISPLSMQFLLGMILDGAKGETSDEICKVLGYGKGETEAVNEYCLSMLKQLPGLDKKTKLNIANAIFVKKGRTLLDTYRTDVSKYFDAKVDFLDFSDNERSLKAINGWCSKQTDGHISKILDKVDQNNMAYLLNAIYFKSQWKEKFEKSRTTEEVFTRESGSKANVMMMKQNESYSYNENDVFKIVQIPYGNGAFSMIALLPQKGKKVADVVDYLKKNDWNSVRRDFVPCEVDLWLPRFETKFSINLNAILSAMGMPSSFSPALADFTAMSKDALCLSFVQQDAVIKVDEEGTVAAAISSAGMMDYAAAPGTRVEFHADHPFIYLITESSTGAVLFAGRYSNN